MHVTWSGPNLARTPLAVIAPAFTPANVRFAASAFSGSYIRHMDSRGRIDPNVSPLADSQWRMVPGLADPLGVSFESVNFPGQYVRHRNGEVWKDANDGTDLFKADATWRVRVGFANANQMSFESINFPGNFMRHGNSLLYSEPIRPTSSTTDKADATFFLN
ncbi:AbfB domain-containing protein [Piscinibacter terrae]|nr:AbfB domain-containing protein [Albitalea terrae]